MRMIKPVQNMTKSFFLAERTSWTDCEIALKWGRLKSRHIFPEYKAIISLKFRQKFPNNLAGIQMNDSMRATDKATKLIPLKDSECSRRLHAVLRFCMRTIMIGSGKLC